jgi:hypothetical protein
MFWPWRIGDALRVIAASGGGALTWDISRHPREAATERALARLISDLRAKGYSDPSNPANLERLVLAKSLQSQATLLRIDVRLSLKQADPVAQDLVALALFGTRAGPSLSDGAEDLRGLIAPLGAPRLLPYAQELTDLVATPQVSSDERQFVIGRTAHGTQISLGQEDRMRHLWLLGGTGTGKSTTMRSLIAQDIAAGEGVILIDPHGDISNEVAEAVPAERRHQLMLADAADPSSWFALDLLRSVRDEASRERAADTLTRLFSTVLYSCDEAFGPMFDQYFRSALFLLALGGGPEAPLADIVRLFSDQPYRERLIAACKDEAIVRFWRDVAQGTSGDYALANITPYVTSKLTRLVDSPLARRLFGGGKGSIDFAQAMDEGGILILRCPKGPLGETTAQLAAAACLMEIGSAAMARAQARSRRPVRLYVDEMQSCPGEMLAVMLAEGRKFGLSLCLANQSLSQVGGVAPRSLGGALLANVGNILLFRLGVADATALSPWLDRPDTWNELCRQPDFSFHARMLRGGRPISIGGIKVS